MLNIYQLYLPSSPSLSLSLLHLVNTSLVAVSMTVLPLMKAGKLSNDELTKFLQSPQLGARWWPGLTGRMQHWSWTGASVLTSQFNIQLENYQ